ncbi:MAG: DUF362 domain-containing protein [Verrucomicrobiota bacterium]
MMATRFLVVLFTCLRSLFAADVTPLPVVPSVSTVFCAQDSFALTQLEENPAVTRRMVDQIVLAVTKQPDVRQAWRSLVSPTDLVGIKVCAAGGRYFASHLGIVEAVVAGLTDAGIPPNRIIVWDRDPDKLQAAGFLQRRGSYQVRSIPPVVGYDPKAVCIVPTIGKLIWGDVLFQDSRSRGGKRISDAEQLSSASHIAKVLSQEVTKVINVPVLSNDAFCGVAGALYNMTIANLDNWRRFTQVEGGAEAIPDLYANPSIGPKVVLTIMDALRPQYAGGPNFDPNYAFSWGAIYGSTDPVALDSVAVRLIEDWRKEAKLPPIGKRADWLEGATEAGLGNFAKEKIFVRPVGKE